MEIIKNTKKWILIIATMLIPIIGIGIIISETNARIEGLEKEVLEVETMQEELILEKNELESKLSNQREASNAKDLEIKELKDKESELIQSNKELEEEKERLEKIKTPSRSKLPTSKSGNASEFTVTAYDLSVDSCGKKPNHPQYGMTRSGSSLIGHTWKTARAIATDPKVIPLGSKVEVTFLDESYSKYNGTYTSVDTGSAVKGKIIDLFLGDYNQERAHQDVWDFGRAKAIVRILE